ncbi:beta-propeller domain-containing protein [uncultured Nocardioides sp.]|uniref:beta-propeller domain-containing protein n=2 Tax=uncultured Nocardioides sp. TaxID=198441 RepID=UPI002639CCF3|nr:beta-propeller domain-containing protein [uncultured Nocardioides sp.]
MRARTLLTSLTATALVGAGVLVGLSLDAGPGGRAETSASEERASRPRPVAWQGDDLTPAASCEQLHDWYVDGAEELVTPWGWSGGLLDVGGAWRTFARDGVLELQGFAAAQAPAPTNARGMTNATQSKTGTNVQEAGVDEPDVAKSDGRLLARVERTGRTSDLVLADVTGETVEESARIDLPDVVDPELLLVGDTVVVVGGDQEADGSPGTRILRVDVTDLDEPTLTDTLTIDAELLAARQHGSTVRWVTRSGLPDLDFARPGRRAGSEDRALQRNLAAVRGSGIDDWLPHVTTYAEDGTATTERLVECDEVALPGSPGEADGATPGTVAVVGLDATAPLAGLGDADAVGVAVSTDLVYASTDRLYLATSGAPTGCCWTVDRALPGGPTGWPVGGWSGTSEVHELELAGTAATYVASGEVDGTIRDRWSMDEHDGVLRVAVGPSSETGDFSSIVTMRRDGTRLEEIGRVDRIGPREDIEAVRWFGDLALVVTFRRVDPLYTVDLSDQTAPRVVGELKVPGYSAYLHPLGPHRLLGLGEGPVAGRRWGAQTSLFDLADLAAPRRLDVLDHRVNTRHVAATDPRAFTWIPGKRTGLSVITRGYGARTGWLSIIRLDDGTISEELVEVEHGSDVDHVRLLRLPDTRVLLVTAEKASYVEV